MAGVVELPRACLNCRNNADCEMKGSPVFWHELTGEPSPFDALATATRKKISLYCAGQVCSGAEEVAVNKLTAFRRSWKRFFQRSVDIPFSTVDNPHVDGIGRYINYPSGNIFLINPKDKQRIVLRKTSLL